MGTGFHQAPFKDIRSLKYCVFYFFEHKNVFKKTHCTAVSLGCQEHFFFGTRRPQRGGDIGVSQQAGSWKGEGATASDVGTAHR